MERLDEAIREIVESFPHGLVFDAHTVIFNLKQTRREIYDHFSDGLDTANYHSIISRKIKKLQQSYLIERVFEQSQAYSWNIHKKNSRCACWVRR
ncbi:MAG TPA: hypothetical protein PLQ05_02850 [Acidobacteriota bacterium]|nr:hypothetical protein [Acidobacteriota bacterium]HQO21134.1 hypothetical protein [Acidobacteriota bacterium]